MSKFTFNSNRTAAKKKDLFDVLRSWDEAPEYNLENIRIRREHQESRKQDRRRRAINRLRRIHDSRPYGIYRPGEEDNPGEIVWIDPRSPEHRDKLDARGFSQSVQFKNFARTASSGFHRMFLPVEHYLDNPQWTRRAPRGLEVFVPNSHLSSRPQPREVLDFAKTIDLSNARSRLRGMTIAEDDLLLSHPNHPLNALFEEGIPGMMRSIFTDQYHKQQPLRDDLCVCGHAPETHVSEDAAEQHFADNGEHLEIHKFTPQSGADTRSTQSLLRSALLPKTRGSQQMEFRRGDIDVGGSYYPAVLIGSEGVPLTRSVTQSVYTNADGTAVNPFAPAKMPKMRECPGDGVNKCYGGKRNPEQRVNRTGCTCCAPGELGFDEATGRLKTIGLGNGRVRYVNEEDAPVCPTCDGDKFKLVADKSGNTEVPCSTCDASGRDPRATGKIGVPCRNCDSANSIIMLTDDNLCRKCHGKSVLPELVMPKERTLRTQTSSTNFTGNPVLLVPFNTRSNGVDAYGAPNSRCTRCHGDRNYKMETGSPCNCRIRRLDDTTALVSPSDARYIFYDHVRIPEVLYQSAMSSAYKDPRANPHKRLNDVNAIDPETGLPASGDDGFGVKYDIGLRDLPSYGPEHVIGVWHRGITLPQEKLDELRAERQRIRSGPNADLCGATEELEAVYNAIKDFRSLPVAIERPRVVSKPRDARRNRVDVVPFHPSVQAASKRVEGVVDTLGSAGEDLNGLIEPVYDLASRIRQTPDTETSPMYNDYEKAVNSLLSETATKHGIEKADELHKAIVEGLPAISNPDPLAPFRKTDATN